MGDKRKQNTSPPESRDVPGDENVSEIPTEPAGGAASRQHPARTETIVLTWEGPLPPPALLEQYDQVVPGLAKQIAEQLRTESDHVRRLEETALRAGISDRTRRQWIAATVVFAILAVSVLALVLGAFWIAGIALSMVTGAAALFITGVFKRKGKTGR